MAHPLPPLLLTPVYKEKIWGGQNLARTLKKTIPPHKPVGECWEVSGVAGDETPGVNPPYTGLALNAIAARYGSAFLGTTPQADGDFPLLYKFIDAQDKLSVQVHPDDAQARTNGWGARGKTECWYIADAAPGAQLICGVNPGVTAADIKHGIEHNTLEKYLNVINVRAGDVVFVPAGTIHAIGAGILLYEVQETSDTTFRLYDYGRTDDQGNPRDLHIKASLAVMDCIAHNNHVIEPVTIKKTSALHHCMRVACAYFALEEYRFITAAHLTLAPRESFAVCTVMQGRGTLQQNGAPETSLDMGQSIVLAAQGLDQITIAMEAGALLLVSWVPHLAREVITPLRAAGVPENTLKQLGGFTERNALVPLL